MFEGLISAVDADLSTWNGLCLWEALHTLRHFTLCKRNPVLRYLWYCKAEEDPIRVEPTRKLHGATFKSCHLSLCVEKTRPWGFKSRLIEIKVWLNAALQKQNSSNAPRTNFHAFKLQGSSCQPSTMKQMALGMEGRIVSQGLSSSFEIRNSRS
jgi:hypothetical protein